MRAMAAHLNIEMYSQVADHIRSTYVTCVYDEPMRLLLIRIIALIKIMLC